MNQDQEHLRLLSLFHYICAGLTALFACLPIIHLVIGLVMVLRPDSFGPGKNQPPAFVGWFFIGIASVIIFCGWTLAALMAWTGRCLARRKHHTFCMVVAGVSCVLMPLGTLLGVFTIIVLSRPTVRALFAAGSVTPPQP